MASLDVTRIAVISSSGGSALAEVVRACPHVEFFALTDRACGAEDQCNRLGVRHVRIEESDNTAFCHLAADAIAEWGDVSFVILFFHRVVTEPLLGCFPVLNIHPALLPAFKGLGAVRSAHDCGARFFGATLHQATVEVDGGPIIAQVSQPVPPGSSLEHLEKLSFLHKVLLFLLAVDLTESGLLQFRGHTPVMNSETGFTDRINPALSNGEYLRYVERLEEREGVKVL